MERDGREGKGSACSNPIVTFIPPPKSGCQMISNKNLEEFSREKNARTTTCERQILMADAPHIVEKKKEVVLKKKLTLTTSVEFVKPV